MAMKLAQFLRLKSASISTHVFGSSTTAYGSRSTEIVNRLDMLSTFSISIRGALIPSIYIPNWTGITKE